MGLFGKGVADVWDGLGDYTKGTMDGGKMLGGLAKMAGGAVVGAAKLGAKGVKAAKNAKAKAAEEASEPDDDDEDLDEAGPKFCPHCGKPL